MNVLRDPKYDYFLLLLQRILLNRKANETDTYKDVHARLKQKFEEACKHIHGSHHIIQHDMQGAWSDAIVVKSQPLYGKMEIWN